MNEAVDPDSPIGRQARTWVLAVFGEAFPPERAESLRLWLDADPRHMEAYERTEALMLALGNVEALSAKTARTWLRPSLAAGAALAACLVGAVVLGLPGATINAGSSLRTVTLKDGSFATLAPGSRLRPASRWSDRRYVLERGEAFFEVRHVESRRFQVAAGDVLIEVLGTRFDARRTQSGQIRIAVEKGLVAVYDTPSKAPRKLAAKLRAGDYLLRASGQNRVGKTPNGEPIGAWRTGRLAYSDAPLGDVIADLNGYERTYLRISPEASALRVTTSFGIHQAESFITNLPGILPVTVKTDADGVRVIALQAKPTTIER